MVNCRLAIVVQVYWPRQPCTFTSLVHDSESNDLRWRSLALEKDDSSHLLSTTNHRSQTLLIQCSNFITASGRWFLVMRRRVFLSLTSFFECWLTINLLYRRQATSYLSEGFKILVYVALHGFRAKCIDSAPQVLSGGGFTHWLWNQGWAAWNCILFFWLFICGTSTSEVCLNLQLKSDKKTFLLWQKKSLLSIHQPVFKKTWLSLYYFKFSASCHLLHMWHTAFRLKTELPPRCDTLNMDMDQKIRYFFDSLLKKREGDLNL